MEAQTEARGQFGESLNEIHYFGLISKPAGKRFVYAEVEVIRRGGRQVFQTETGVTYRTQREAIAENGRKNADVLRAQH